MNRPRLMTTGLIALLVSVAFALLVWTAGDGRETNRTDSPTREPTYLATGNEPDTSTIRTGRRLYRRHCVSCHGKQGRGKGPASPQLTTVPLNFHSDTVATNSDRQLYEQISEGKPSTGMPGWAGRLSRDQRWAVVAYVNKAFVEEEFDSPPLR